MASLNPYLAYKRDTNSLVYWIVNTSNAISTSPTVIAGNKPQTSGKHFEIKVADLVSLSKLISKSIDTAPAPILALFDAVIRARTQAYESFQRLNASQRDPDVERSNTSHKFFIDALTQAFNLLGGEAWLQQAKSRAQRDTAADEAKLDEVLFTNHSSSLNIDSAATNRSEDADLSGDDSPAEISQQQAPQSRQQKQFLKDTKGKISKRRKRQDPNAAQAESLDEIPMESYRLIQDEDGIVTDYLMAVYDLIDEWVDLRAYVQGLWYEVAYSGLNSAAAGALTKIAINMVQRSAATMFVDFPGHDSYETVMNTITRGNPDTAQGRFRTSLYEIAPNQTDMVKLKETKISVKEQFLIYTYQDLLEFVSDFQKNRTGKPTKRMAPRLRDWNPGLDLQAATEDERLEWRRCYTITWLYDLVNLFSAIVVQRNTLQGENHELEKVDWSPSGPWDMHRRLYGLNELAGFVTHLAYQKAGSDIRNKILPHHVFQLQCIVDSFTISRGWSLSALHGHVLTQPAGKFRPSRDIDIVLDRQGERFGHGLLPAVEILKQFLQSDGILHGDCDRHQSSYDMIDCLGNDFFHRLGESKYKYGLKTIPPSRFSASNTNGLWDYCPLLCGAGLAEGLAKVYEDGVLLLDRLPHAFLLIHLHNMLVQKKYIEQPVGLYMAFQDLFQDALFVDGKIPTSKYGEALLARLGHRRGRRKAAQSRGGFQENRCFKTKPFLMACQEAGWDVDKVSGDDIPSPSLYAFLRIKQSKSALRTATSNADCPDTSLVRRVKAAGYSEKAMTEMMSDLPGRTSHSEPVPRHVLESAVPEGHTLGDAPKMHHTKDGALSGRDLLACLKLDIMTDVHGELRPFSGLNYIWVIARFMMRFEMFEEELKNCHNPLYVEAYERDPELKSHKRLGLVVLALQVQEEECLRVMAKAFQNPRAGFMNHIYWDNLTSASEEAESHLKNEPVDTCNLM